MSVYEKIFDENVIYNTLFFDVKTVTEFESLTRFESNDPSRAKLWKKKYGDDQDTYLNESCYNADFGKILLITAANIINDGEGLKRNLVKFSGENELTVINSFFEYLNQRFIDGQESMPKTVFNLSGHNVRNFAIPFLIKRYLLLTIKNGIDVSQINIPPLLKIGISSKPWESNIIDTIDINKFNGVEASSLELIARNYDLKMNIDGLKDNHELSKSYWSDKKDVVLKEILDQSLNTTNLVLQFINLVRNI
jgi:hypothetical protein